MNFNITLIHPKGNDYAMCLSEAADYVGGCLKALGHSILRTSNYLVKNSEGLPYTVNVIFGGHLLGVEHHAGLTDNCIAFNSEPLMTPWWGPYPKEKYTEFLNARMAVWDYTSANSELYAPKERHVIPFLYLKDLARDPPHANDGRLLFFGSLSDRRHKIFDGLQHQNVHVNCLFNIYGPDRDAKMCRAKAVLNVAKWDQNPFEALRVHWPLMNGVPVICEETDDPAADAYRPFCFFFERRTFAKDVKTWIADTEAWSRTTRQQLEAFKASDPLPAFRAATSALLAAPTSIAA